MLVERERLLGDLVAETDDAARIGRGRLVFLGGEAGVGKTALVRALADAVRDRMPVRVGRADNVTTAGALAPFSEALPTIDTAEGDRIRLFRRIRDALQETPSLLILEDLHWADEATLDALRYLGRRLDGVPALIVATYRDDEVGARHPLTRLLGDLAAVPETTRMQVPPLSIDGVAALAAHTDVDPVLLHARTRGNAFFVTEVLASDSESLPATVSDAILARVSALDVAGQDAAAAAAVVGAVLGAPADPALLATVAGRDVAAVDQCADAGVLVAERDGFGFRHILAREAVEGSLSASQRRELHRRALSALAERTPDDHRTLAHHAAGCGDDAAAAWHAARAAEQAARLGAHRESAEHDRMALRHELDPTARAAVSVALSYECYLTDQLPEAIAARQRALELHEVAGDASSVGDDERWLSRLSWFLGRGADAERYAARAIATLEPLARDSRLAMAYSNLAQLRMLAKDSPEAERWGEQALRLARELGDVEIEVHALNNLGTAAMGAGRVPEGEALLTRSLDLALSADMHEHVARAYTNLGWLTMEQHRCAVALARLDAGIAYCNERDLDSWARYMRSGRCQVLADIGRFDDALADAAAVLDHPDTAPISAIPAAAAAASIRSRRGEDPRAQLESAAALAATTRELQRVGPVACALAEDAWLRGDLDVVASATDVALELALAHDDPWMTGELAWWRMLAGIPAPDAPMAEPFALMIAGSSDAAASAWDGLGSAVWAAYARAFSSDAATAAEAVRTFDALGASAVVTAVLRTRHERGLPLPRRPHAATRAHPGLLTDRELDVLRLLGEGLSTAQIADQLVVSPRTVEHHVSAVLRKLGEPTRARAVAAARAPGGALAAS
ncbi:ATP-binding protein [Microbacterium sp. ASV49]|uniref:LuxR C-terminal-related transcriptional regulator n=1 Tax=Microbacterium candidum TaxID=3041922 RepID=A0ABT7MX84_9MICO|nr:AAA family ATPase [Microbacterium sp. ASV49]MDL9979057.1 LuxR C-terminal-related transcriptional regulator [Microbacterium sp. ASV49]